MSLKDKNMKQDIYKLLRWIRLREIEHQSKDEQKEEKSIHLYFKEKYGIRLFETEYDEILNKIFGDWKE